MIKTPSKLEIERNFLNLTKGVSEKPTANIVNIIFNEEKLNAFILKSGKRQEYPLSLLLLNIVLEDLTWAIKQGKTRHSDQKEEVTLSSFADDMILYREYSKESTKNLLE